jgi:hypothetical protein
MTHKTETVLIYVPLKVPKSLAFKLDNFISVIGCGWSRQQAIRILLEKEFVNYAYRLGAVFDKSQPFTDREKFLLRENLKMDLQRSFDIQIKEFYSPSDPNYYENLLGDIESDFNKINVKGGQNGNGE